jgi:hypothetical protein
MKEAVLISEGLEIGTRSFDWAEEVQLFTQGWRQSSVSETSFQIKLQCWMMSETLIILLIYHWHKILDFKLYIVYVKQSAVQCIFY